MTPSQRAVLRRLESIAGAHGGLWLDHRDRTALLQMLYEAEGRADRAEWRHGHHCELNPNWDDAKGRCIDERHTWTPDQWTSAASARLEGEDAHTHTGGEEIIQGSTAGD